MKYYTRLFLMLIALTTTTTRAQLVLPKYFSDHMVLQRDKPNKVWGWAEPGQKIVVNFRDKRYQVSADKDSLWSIELPKSQAGGPYSMLLSSNAKQVEIKDIYFGDVWFCSGQSNMRFRMKHVKDHDLEIKDADYPLIRQFDVALQTAITPQKDARGQWSVASSQTIDNFSAVAWFFAKELYRKNKVPVAILHSSWGGSPIETFMNAETLEEFPLAKSKIEVLSPEFIRRTKASNKALTEATGTARPEGFVNIENGYPSLVYNAMIAPFFNQEIKGFLWYQGEANSFLPACYQYERMLSLLVQSWRKSWRNEALPFLLVQLPNYGQASAVPVASGWTIVQEAQFKVSRSLKNVGLVVTQDLGDPADIHPANKQEVGKRAAASALKDVYGDKKRVAQGPELMSLKTGENKIVLTFKNIGSGIAKDRGNMLNAFSVAGADQKYYRATAEIKGDHVVVYSSDVSLPLFVRYAFESNPGKINFYNKEGFPALPFRTDQLKDASKRN